MLDNQKMQSLLIETALGNRKAFSQLYAKTSPILFSISMRLLKEASFAEEALQEAFVHIWYKASEYSPDKGEAFPWLVSIVRYRSLDIMRREDSQKNRQDSLIAETENDWQQDLDDMMANGLSESMELKLLMECLDLLQPEQRKSVLLSYYYGYSQSELVAKLNSPLGTVKSWIRRGMQSVRECMS